MKINNIYVGDNIEVLKTFPDNSIDSVVTDPPYGLGKEPNAIEVLQSWITIGYHEVKGKGFMGKEWDAFVPQPNFWKEIYRVLKPGGYLLSFAGTRTYDWMVMALRLAGFEIRDMIAWVYGSGFPKSMDVSKAIESKLINGNSNKKSFSKLKGERLERGNWGITKNSKEYGFRDKDYTHETDQIDRLGKLEATTDEAKQWQGWGTALKPALEPIVMARKPLDGTVAQNVLKHGVGGINIDGCRVGDEIIGGGTMPDLRDVGKKSKEAIGIDKLSFGQVKNAKRKEYKTHQGRFPANFIHDGSEEVENLFPLENEESPSRFFYVAKASQEERNFGLYDFKEQQTTDGCIRSNQETARTFGANSALRKNIHPTVKPIELMRYLVKMITPPNGICLDPYLGSGTTAIACEMEKFNYIGIELVPEYAEIAKARVGAVKDYESTLDTKTIIKESIKEDKEKELGIQTIFDFMEE